MSVKKLEIKLTLNVVTENLTMTLGTTLSETLHATGCQRQFEQTLQTQHTFPPLPRPDIVKLVEGVVEGW